jgi:GTP-binding protein Era
VPYELYLSKNTPFESPEHSKILEVALIGAPNAGKSSLMNKLIGEDLSAVSNKRATTDEAVTGVYTNIEKRTQIVFYDTPGITQYYKNTRHFVTKAWEVLDTCDKALFVVDSVKRVDDAIKEALHRLKKQRLNEGYRKKMRKMKQDEDNIELTEEFMNEMFNEEVVEEDNLGDQTIPTYLVLNKIDLCMNKRKLKNLINELEEISRFEKIFFTSAETGYGLPDILTSLEAEAYPKSWDYNPASKSDASEIEMVEQMMKSLIYQRFYKEVPYMIGIRVTEFRIRSDGLFKVEFALDVENQSQVPLVVGKQGRNIKWLKERIEMDLAQKYQKEVFAQFTVKLRTDRLDVSNEKGEDIIKPGYGLEKAEEEQDAIRSGAMSIHDAMKR